ncbi:hypothetical protein RJ639_023283 [Escallonia herrerae]|uniref:RGS domain-containing protein n=1 Tax=Escallonia herrerae TaxID=1293975 RepID=A0AA88V0L5_9ASTE|nr:hypothetical protein RJ639_023283 [Escallonia herrerae]
MGQSSSSSSSIFSLANSATTSTRPELVPDGGCTIVHRRVKYQPLTPRSLFATEVQPSVTNGQLCRRWRLPKVLARSTLPFIIHKVPRPKGSSFWIPAIQIFASFNLLSSIVPHVLRFCDAGIWVIAYILNEIHEEVLWLQVTSRFLLLVMASIFVLAFFSVSSSQPLVSLMSLRKNENREIKTMGLALGIPDSGLLLQREPSETLDSNEPLDKLLLDKKFRQSFMAFADSCLAGESVHFYEEVQQLDKIPVNDPVRRIYMARYIVEKYILAGATMEVNISHRSRQEILSTIDLAHPDLFKNALNELMHLMKTNLAKDYWSSMFFMRYKEATSMKPNDRELEQFTGWNFSPRLSSVHCADDPFHQDHAPRDSGRNSHDSDMQ